MNFISVYREKRKTFQPQKLDNYCSGKIPITELESELKWNCQILQNEFHRELSERRSSKILAPIIRLTKGTPPAKNDGTEHCPRMKLHLTITCWAKNLNDEQ